MCGHKPDPLHIFSQVNLIHLHFLLLTSTLYDLAYCSSSKANPSVKTNCGATSKVSLLPVEKELCLTYRVITLCLTLGSSPSGHQTLPVLKPYTVLLTETDHIPDSLYQPDTRAFLFKNLLLKGKSNSTRSRVSHLTSDRTSHPSQDLRYEHQRHG